MAVPHGADERCTETSHGGAIERIFTRFPTHTIGAEEM
jgi:hypothetical protein